MVYNKFSKLHNFITIHVTVLYFLSMFTNCCRMVCEFLELIISLYFYTRSEHQSIGVDTVLVQFKD